MQWCWLLQFVATSLIDSTISLHWTNVKLLYKGTTFRHKKNWSGTFPSHLKMKNLWILLKLFHTVNYSYKKAIGYHKLKENSQWKDRVVRRLRWVFSASMTTRCLSSIRLDYFRSHVQQKLVSLGQTLNLTVEINEQDRDWLPDN